MQKRTYQQLQSEERMTIVSMRQEGSSVRAMARTLGRLAAAVSRELARNTGPSVGYASVSAHALSTTRGHAAHPRVKLHVQSVARGVVLTLLDWKWSPQQISGTLQLAQRSYPARLARDHLHGYLCPAARRAAPPAHRLPAPWPQHAHVAHARYRPARADSRHGRHSRAPT
jgi:IS30 family transposase